MSNGMDAINAVRDDTMKKRNRTLFVFVLPTLIYILLFKVIPFLGNIIAFENYKIRDGVLHSEFIGIQNFVHLFSSKTFWNAFINTITLNSLDLLVSFPFTIILSLMLVEIRQNYRKIMQLCLYLPYFISWAALGGIIIHFLSPSVGFVSTIGTLLGIGNNDLPYLMGDSKSWLLVYILSSIWQSAGWGTIIYVAAISKIDRSLYEAAAIDGTNRFQQALYITLPQLVPLISVMFVLKVSSIVSSGFEQVYALANPMVSEISNVISTYEYKVGLQGMQYGYATALGFFESAISLVLLTLGNVVVKKLSKGEFGV